ncbi:hypothetical protein P7D22_19585 [Lichenihabitans sp. Uapishka_5]|uniref:hypothetical protein n=1 Tax=Lichenihabitans sp. Uapishka_5 TaxID=3037302 RepID=UPI0029E7DD87|nr:hypothetical protein [Lichenihabitans sp. Uapishka_5]MDX7953370.1 hypothetical protein [Lichenihabitans sp. Uapishka_5]
MPSTFWTAALVADHLVQAFRVLPGRAVFTSGGTFRAYDAHPSTADAFSWAPRFLADHPRSRLHLFAWARCRSQREPWSAMCREMGWPLTSADTSRKLAAELIAAGLNREATERHAALLCETS